MATQAEKDAAKLKVTNAKTAMDSAYASMTSWCNVVSTRTYTEGTNKITCSQKVPVVCGEQIYAICCKSTKYSDSTCESDKNTYNARVLDYDKKTEEYETAKDEYETISGEVFDAGQGNAERDAAQIRTSYYVFGGIVVVLIIAGIFIWIKYKKK